MKSQANVTLSLTIFPDMFELWIPITVAAAFLQNLRSALQKHVKADLGTTGATFVRFGYGFPAALLYVAGLNLWGELPLPRPGLDFAGFATLGGVAQILATAFLVALFGARSFAVATTYSKTETVQAALFGIVILGDHISLGAAIGILISLAGVLVLSRGSLAGAQGRARPVLMGLASGACFAVAAVCYRAASLSLGGEGFLMQAGFTLAFVTVVQTALMAAYMAWREPGALLATLRAWRSAIWVGLSGIAASACWFTAMTLETVAHVRALGQIELIFTLAASALFFGEKLRRSELLGMALVVAGILWLLLGR